MEYYQDQRATGNLDVASRRAKSSFIYEGPASAKSVHRRIMKVPRLQNTAQWAASGDPGRSALDVDRHDERFAIFKDLLGTSRRGERSAGTLLHDTVNALDMLDIPYVRDDATGAWRLHHEYDLALFPAGTPDMAPAGPKTPIDRNPLARALANGESKAKVRAAKKGVGGGEEAAARRG